MGAIDRRGRQQYRRRIETRRHSANGLYAQSRSRFPRDALNQARERGAKIMGVEVDGGYLPFDAAMVIPQGSVAILQPPAQHEIVSDEKVVITAEPAKSAVSPPGDSMTERADNMQKPGNWHKPSWDPNSSIGSWSKPAASCADTKSRTASAFMTRTRARSGRTPPSMRWSLLSSRLMPIHSKTLAFFLFLTWSFLISGQKFQIQPPSLRLSRCFSSQSCVSPVSAGLSSIH